MQIDKDKGEGKSKLATRVYSFGTKAQILKVSLRKETGPIHINEWMRWMDG